MTENEIWKSINDTRFDRCKRNPEVESELEGMSWNVEKLSHLLGIKNISDEANEEFSNTSKKSLYEMFMVLNKFPSYFEILYGKTIYGPQSRLIMLASNILNKSPYNFKMKAKLIYKKITSIIFMKYHRNESFESGTDILTGKGKINLI